MNPTYPIENRTMLVEDRPEPRTLLGPCFFFFGGGGGGGKGGGGGVFFFFFEKGGV